MSITRKFLPNSGIWFVIEMDDAGEVTSVEEHDWREGGWLGAPDTGKTWEETFLSHAHRRYRGSADEEAVAFLDQMRREIKEP